MQIVGDHRNCEQDAARSIKRICVGQPTTRRRFITHDLEKCREDAGQGADAIGHGGHHFGERDPGSCMACFDVTPGRRLVPRFSVGLLVDA